MWVDAWHNFGRVVGGNVGNVDAGAAFSEQRNAINAYELARWQVRQEDLERGLVIGVGEDVHPDLIDQVPILHARAEADRPADVVEAATGFLNQAAHVLQCSRYLALQVTARLAGHGVRPTQARGIDHVVDDDGVRHGRLWLRRVDLLEGA